MRKKAWIIPTLSTLLLAPMILTQQVAAEETIPTTGTVLPSPSVPGTSGQDAAATSDLAAPTEEGAVVSAAAEETAETEHITILHTNDIHGRIESSESNGVIGMAGLAEIAKEERAKNPTLVLDAGDAFQGMPISNSTKGEDMANLMNQVGYDAMTVGNHEFDFGLDQLKKLKGMVNFPIISSNIYVDGVRLFDASTIIDKTPDVAGDEFVVIGVSTPETLTKTHPKNVKGVEFRDPITEVTQVVRQVQAAARAEGKDYQNYIVLSHLGVDATTPEKWRGTTLAESLSNMPELADKNVIVIDGHSHTLLSNKYGNHTTYNQTGSYLNNIGKITLEGPRVLSAGVIPYQDTQNVTPDAAVTEEVAAVKERFEAENAKVVRESSPVTLNGDRNNVRVRETNQGNAITDALWAYGQTGFQHKTDIAVMNGGGIRETLHAGEPITAGDVISVLPFGNSISQITVSGSQIRQMFEKSLSAILQKDENGQPVLDENGRPLMEASGGFLQVSGAKVYYDTTLPADKRIYRIEVLDHDTNTYLPLDEQKTYYLATNDFMAAGGDGYTMLGGAREEGPSLDMVYKDFLATADLTQYAAIAPNSRLISSSAPTKTDDGGQEEEMDPVTPAPVVDPDKETSTVPAPTPNEDQTAQPVLGKEDAAESSASEESDEVTADSQPSQEQAQLPRTGEAATSLWSVMGLAILGWLGIRTKHKKQEKA